MGMGQILVTFIEICIPILQKLFNFFTNYLPSRLKGTIKFKVFLFKITSVKHPQLLIVMISVIS